MPVAETILRNLAQNPLSDFDTDEAEHATQAKRVLEQVQNAAAPDKAANAAADEDPRNRESYTFSLDWTDSRGKRWQGEFTTKILNLQEQQAMGILRARYQAGTELSALDRATATLNLQLAHLQYALTKRPTWAENLLTLLDPRLVAAIYEHVTGHESFFWRYSSDPAQG
jgi:hypothetical protein